MVEEFDLLEEVEVQFCDEECTESVWHGVNYSESLFCREKPKSELTVVIREEGMMYFLTADIKEFAGLCRKHRVVHRLAPAVQRGDGNRHVPDGSRETCGMVFAGQVEGMECHDEGCAELYV